MLFSISIFILPIMSSALDGLDSEGVAKFQASMKLTFQRNSRRFKAGHPIHLNRTSNDSTDGFPRNVYGKELLEVWVDHLKIIPALMNVLILTKRLNAGTLSREELTKQLLNSDFPFDHVREFYNQKSIGGFWQQRNFEELVNRRLPMLERSFREDILNRLDDLVNLRNNGNMIWIVEVQNFIPNLKKLLKDCKESVPNKEDIENLKDVIQELEPLNSLVGSEKGYLRNETGVLDWFKENEGYGKRFEKANSFFRSSVSRFEWDISRLRAIEFIPNIMEQSDKIGNPRTSTAKFGMLKRQMKNLEMMRDSNSSSELLDLLHFVKTATDAVLKDGFTNTTENLIPGLPKRFKSIRQVMQDFTLDWLDNIFDSKFPAIQLQFLLQQLKPCIKFFEEFQQTIETIKKSIKGNDALRKDLEILGTRREYYLKLCRPLEVFLDTDVFDGFTNPNISNITETIEKTFWHFNYTLLKNSITEFLSFKFCDSEMSLNSDSLMMSQSKVDKLDEIEPKLENALAMENEVFNCVNLTDNFEEMRSLVDFSEKMWYSGDIKDIWSAVYTLQEFLPTEDILKKLDEKNKEDPDLRDHMKRLNSLLESSGSSLQDVKTIMNGISGIETFYHFYDWRFDMHSWNRTLTGSFRSIKNPDEKSKLLDAWTNISKSYEKFLEDLVKIERRLYSPPSENLEDHLKTIELAASLKIQTIDVNPILEHLRAHFPAESTEFVKQLEWLQEFSENHEYRSLNFLKLKVELSIFKMWLEEVADSTDLREKNETTEPFDPELHCYCGDVLLRGDPCFEMCDMTPEIAELERLKNQKRENEILPFYQVVAIIFVSVGIMIYIENTIRGYLHRRAH